MTEVERPAINRDEGTTLAFSKQDARKLLDLPDPETLEGLRDRAILSVGLQVGLRRAEIAALTSATCIRIRGNQRWSGLHVTVEPIELQDLPPLGEPRHMEGDLTAWLLE